MLECCHRYNFSQRPITWIIYFAIASTSEYFIEIVLERILFPDNHWKANVFILIKCSLLAAIEIAKMKTFRETSDETFVKITIFPIQWTLITARRVLLHYSDKYSEYDIQ